MKSVTVALLGQEPVDRQATVPRGEIATTTILISKHTFKLTDSL